MAGIAESVASKVAENLVAQVSRQCGYVIFSDSHVRQLEDEVKNLDHARLRVQHSIDEAQNNMKPIEEDVKDWVDKVKTIANKARGVLDDDRRAKKTCFYGCLPDLKVRYRLGKEASRTVKDIQELIARSPREKVEFKSPPPGLVGGAPGMNSSAGDGGNTITDSRASIFQGIMKALDDEKDKVIGVYGLGGVGKTTLLEEVEKKLRKEERPFHMIVKSKVSETPDLKKIQYDIAFALSLNSLKDEPSEEGRKNLLLKRLQKDPNEKVLIILDDLWTKLNLEAVGIPLGDASSKCKLLLTSRFKDVLEQMKCAPSIFHLQGLKDDEALKLFEKEVGDRLEDEEELKEIAPQVVKKLAGLPLLIISVARTLKDSDPAAWRDSLIEIDAEDMETIVKFSYEHLKREDARFLFLLCGLIGGTIEVETLLVLGMGLGLFEACKETIQKSRDRLDKLLSQLRSACLLLDGGDDKDRVTIHDLYSEVVVSTPFRGKNSLTINSNYGTWPKKELEECWAGLFNVGNDRLAEIMPYRFPHAKILMLSEQYFMEDCSRMDFTHMKELRALCLCSMSITSLPFSMEILGNLQSLSIDCDAEDVAILGKLKALRILSFAGSRISRLPNEIGGLTNLQSLNLSNCYRLEIIEPGALKRLINLEELHMQGSFVKWMGEHEIPSESYGAELAELKSLTELASLEISIPRPIILLEDGDLPFGNLVRFWIRIGHARGRAFKGLRTMELDLEGCDDILSREWVQKALQKTQYLYLCELSEFKKSAHELCTQGFRELKHLDIDDSPSLEYIANSSDSHPFSKLESLFLDSLINLKKIYHGRIAPVCFSKLKAVRVRRCDRLKYLWRLSDMQRFVQLEEIEVWNCDSLQSIVTHDAGEDIIVSADYKVELPNVRRLVLRYLPNMTSFCARAEITSEDTPIQVSFPCLESLEMVGLLGLEKILYSQPPLQYSNLKSIEISDSRSTSKSILKSDWILKIPNLESLKISSSPSAEVVFDLGELQVSRHVEIFSRLTKLMLRDLPNLQCIRKWDLQLQGKSRFRNSKELHIETQGFRELKHLDIENCPSLKYIANSSDGLPLGAFTKLESLCLDNLIYLEKIYHGPIAPECFSKLKAVIIKRCDRLKYLWRLSDMQRFVQLEEIEVRKCDSMQSIVTHDAGEDIVYADDRVELPNVRRLVLGGELPNMTSFCSRAEITSEDTPIQVSFPRLESLVMVGLLDLEKILHGQPPLEYSNLKSIQISDSRSKSSFLKSDWILKLPNLESLEIRSSPSAEAVFDLGKLKVTRDVEILSRLMELTIWESPNLQCMWKQDVKLQGISIFRNLKKLVVQKTGLAFLFPVSVAKCLREIRDIQVLSCPNMKAVIVDEEGRDEGTNDIIEFPLLEGLHIVNCPMEKFFSYPHGNKEPITATSDSQDAYSDSFFDQKARFPNIISLDIEGAQCKELWNNQIPIDSFCKLKSLDLKHCDNLLRIAPSHMWKRLQRHLETLIVDSCHSIEIIFESDGYAEKNGNLRRLNLWNLTKLRHIWQYDGLPKGGEIRDIEVKNCPNMKAVIVDEEGRDEGRDDIIEFPLLERIHISCCPIDKFFSHPRRKKEPITATSDSQDAYSNSFFDPKVSLPSLKMLFFHKVGSFKRIWHGELPKSSFCKLATLTLDNCSELLNVFPSTIIGRLHNLKSVEIINCPSLESLFDYGSLDANIEQTSVLLPKLEQVRVREAGKMRCMVKNNSQMIWGFPSLKVVRVVNCSNMKYLFPHFTATTLEKLERIDIKQCEQMKEVVLEEEGGRSKVDVMSFPSLRHLSILQCPNFGAFIWSPTSVKRQLDKTVEENDESPQPLFNEMVTFPNIRSLAIEGLRCKELWNNQSPTNSFCKLESLGLKNCANLQRIASSHMWKRLECCLEILHVISCGSIEIIYEGDGMDRESGKLRRLGLCDLENLRHIWQSDLPNVPFPNLRYVKAVRCSRLEMLFATFTAKFLGQIEELVVESCEDMELIARHERWEEATHTTITFSKLTALELIKLPKFRSFLPEKYTLKFPYSEDFPSLRHLSIASCGAEPDRGDYAFYDYDDCDDDDDDDDYDICV